ncbi:MAG: ParA family protein [Planctomycetota bacterium]|nr:ParA family protein [Planctomycetota bacterium]
MKPIAIINEKGGTAKTTTAVNLSAALADLHGQAASSRWLGVEEDSRLAEAIIAGGGLVPIATHVSNLWLAPASGKLDSISHELRPTQGGQLRRVLAELDETFDFCLMDCPPSLGNRLIGNALLAAQAAIVPVETSILALDGLRILLTVLEDVRKGFEHDIELMGVLACRYDARTRLSRLVAAELERALPGRTFHTRIREAVRIRECPAVSKTIFEYAGDCTAAADYRALAGEILQGRPALASSPTPEGDLAGEADLSGDERRAVGEFRRHAAKWFATGPGGEGPAMTEEIEAPLAPPSREAATGVGDVVVSTTASPASPPVVAAAPEPAVAVAVTHATPPPDEPDAWASAARAPLRAGATSAASSLAKTFSEAAAGPAPAHPAPGGPGVAWVATPPKGQAPAWGRWRVPATTTRCVLTVLGGWLAWRAAPWGSTPATTLAADVAVPTTAPAPLAPSAPAPAPAPAVVTPAPPKPPVAAAAAKPVPLPAQAAPPPLPAPVVAAAPLPPAPTAPKAPKAPRGPEYVTPPPDMSISAVMRSGDDNLAEINGKILQAGQTIRGWRVVAIGENSVELEREGKRCVLRLGVSGSSK